MLELVSLMLRCVEFVFTINLNVWIGAIEFFNLRSLAPLRLALDANHLLQGVNDID